MVIKNKLKKPEELKSFIYGIKLRTSNNLQKIEAKLMEVIKHHTEMDNDQIVNQLEENKPRLLKLKDLLNTYRIPPPLTKREKKKAIFYNLVSLVMFYLELVLIESEKIIYNFDIKNTDYKDISNAEMLGEDLAGFYKRVDILMRQLDNYDDLAKFTDIFEAVKKEVKQLYPQSKDIKKLMKLSKKLRLFDIEKESLPSLLKSDKKEKKDKKGKESKKGEKDSVLFKVFNKLSLKDQLVEIINSISESKIIKDLGGIVKLPTLYNLIKEENKELEFTIDDLDDSLKHMKKHGYLSEIDEIQNFKLVILIPIELSEDPKNLLQSVGIEGVATKEKLMKRLNWAEPRVDAALQFLIDKNICKSDNNSILSKKFYFPGLS